MSQMGQSRHFALGKWSTKKLPQRRLSKSNLMIADQAAIIASFDFRIRHEAEANEAEKHHRP